MAVFNRLSHVTSAANLCPHYAKWDNQSRISLDSLSIPLCPPPP